ncbi:PilZ domain-containing protein [Hyphomonas chukchiensis]|uniref:PilZ domain-containing protein n=1 Tax=Hyphomonas chukchiensis TaxID=1280947 RepID=UPI0030F63A7C
MPVPHAPMVSTSTLINPNKDRRLHKRIALSLVGRLLDETSADHDVRTVDISCSGAMIRSAHRPQPGAQVICYFNDLGRVAATVIRSGPQGFAVHFKAAQHKRDKLADRLTWLLNKDKLCLADERSAARVATSGPALLTLADGSEIPCRVLDISLTGASFEAEDGTPMVGDVVLAGNVRGEVVRVEQKRFAIRYLRSDEL